MSAHLFNSIEKNLAYIREVFRDNDDLIIRELEVGDIFNVRMCLVFIDGLINKEYLTEYAIEALLREEEIKSFTLKGYKTSIFEAIKKQILYSADIKAKAKWDPIIDAILSEDTLLLVDEFSGLISDTREPPSRGIQEPQTETVVRGPRDGFTESIKINTSMIRRRVKDTRLKVKMLKVGRRSKTDLALMYIDDIVDKKLLDEVNKRISAIDIDAVLDSSILENLIEDNYLSPFPQMENTERPDAVAAAIYEGRIAIVVDNSPLSFLHQPP